MPIKNRERRDGRIGGFENKLDCYFSNYTALTQHMLGECVEWHVFGRRRGEIERRVE